MNIEKSIEILKEFRNYNKFYKEENKNLTITITLEAKESINKAIERLLTAYEKEKEKNKITKQMNENLIEALKESITKDKIKAKIEELEKGNKNTFIRGEKILVLQSLLEKE